MKDDQALLAHIRDAIARIDEYTAEGEVAFLNDRKTQDAVLRNLEIVGEASKNLSTELKATHPDVPWKRIAGMRDKLIHEYFGVNLSLVWSTVEKAIPPFRAAIEEMLQVPRA